MFSIKILETLIDCCVTACVVYKNRSSEARETFLSSVDGELREALNSVNIRNQHLLYHAKEAHFFLEQMLEKEKAKCEEKQP